MELGTSPIGQKLGIQYGEQRQCREIADGLGVRTLAEFVECEADVQICHQRELQLEPGHHFGSHSPAAFKFRKYLVQLSGHQMKYGTASTSPDLLAGYFVLLAIFQSLEETVISIEELEQLAEHTFQAIFA